MAACHEGVFNQENFHAASVRVAVIPGDPARANRLTRRANLQPAQAVAGVLLERYSDGLLPVQRRNARVNALCCE